MANNDIIIKALRAVGEEDAEYLVSLIGSTPGFPEEGIIFRDFMPVLADARGLDILLRAFAETLPVAPEDFNVVAGLESRGFLFGPALANRFGKGFVAIRKAGKLPPPVFAESYDLEDGSASVEIEQNAIRPGQRVLIVDDLIATGGTARAGADLIEKAGGTVAGFSFLMELEGLNGCSRLSEAPISTLIAMPA
mgnify:FL=1